MNPPLSLDAAFRTKSMKIPLEDTFTYIESSTDIRYLSPLILLKAKSSLVDLQLIDIITSDV